MKTQALLRMFQICDSLFPIGTYTLSNGLEAFIAEGIVSDEKSLGEYVRHYLEVLPYNDTGVMLLAYKNAGDPGYQSGLDAIAGAMKGPREVREGSRRLCRRFLKLWEQIDGRKNTPLHRYKEQIDVGMCKGNYAQAAGLYSRMQEVPQDEAASAYTYSILSAVVTNAVKMVPLSQISGQRILYEAGDAIEACVRQADQIHREDLGINGVQFDIEAMRHEHLYSRLYIS